MLYLEALGRLSGGEMCARTNQEEAIHVSLRGRSCSLSALGTVDHQMKILGKGS